MLLKILNIFKKQNVWKYNLKLGGKFYSQTWPAIIEPDMGQKIDWGLSARVFLRTKFENLEFNLNLIFQKQPPVSNITPKTALVSSKAPPFDSWLY